MTCNGEHEAPPCGDPHCWRGIDPVPEVERHRQRVAELDENLRAFGRIESGVNAAINRAGIHCAISFEEAIDQIAAERDRLQLIADAHEDASTPAFDEIAKLCGCPTWEYPGQVIRDVQLVVRERDRLTIELGASKAAVARLEAERYELANCFVCERCRGRVEVDAHWQCRACRGGVLVFVGGKITGRTNISEAE